MNRFWYPLGKTGFLLLLMYPLILVFSLQLMWPSSYYYPESLFCPIKRCLILKHFHHFCSPPFFLERFRSTPFFHYSFQFCFPRSFFTLVSQPNYHERHFRFCFLQLLFVIFIWAGCKHSGVLQQVRGPGSKPGKVPSVDISGTLWDCSKAWKHWSRNDDLAPGP